MQFTLREMLMATIIVALALALWLRGPSAATVAPTQSPMDLAIVGRGYFIVKEWNTGNLYYTRLGRFVVNSTNQMEWSHEGSGYFFEPAITIPSNSSRIEITRDGLVQVLSNGFEHNFTLVGQMQVAIFNSDSDVEPYAGQLLVAKPNYIPESHEPGQKTAPAGCSKAGARIAAASSTSAFRRS